MHVRVLCKRLSYTRISRSCDQFNSCNQFSTVTCCPVFLPPPEASQSSPRTARWVCGHPAVGPTKGPSSVSHLSVPPALSRDMRQIMQWIMWQIMERMM
eukprot:5294439-Pyramimonas_sp.AAC.1